MNEDNPTRIGPHDLGGLPAGPVDRSEHDAAYWERQVDAMLILLFEKDVLIDPAELRRGIESLTVDVYNELSYYERWAGSVAFNLIEKGIVSREELDQRIEKLQAEGGSS